MAARLTLRNLGKDYPGPAGTAPTIVLDGIDLDVPAGSIVSVVGLNGSGKTTLVRIVAGLEPASRGAVLIDGRPPAGPPNGRIGLVGQDVALLPWRTVRRNIEIGLELRGLPPAQRAARARDYLDSFGLTACQDLYPKALSGGMRQKAAIARTLVAGPELVLMDEPFSALDCQTRNRMQHFLLDVWSRRGDTILFVTHSIEEAVMLSDQIVILSPKPCRVAEIVAVAIPRPRDRTDAENNALRRRVLDVLRRLARGGR